jgi:hypothetical protein
LVSCGPNLGQLFSMILSVSLDMSAG